MATSRHLSEATSPPSAGQILLVPEALKQEHVENLDGVKGARIAGRLLNAFFDGRIDDALKDRRRMPLSER